MRSVFINSDDDMQWLFSTHCKNVKPELRKCKSAIVYGNEDCPDKVELYWAWMPYHYDMPAAEITPQEVQELVSDGEVIGWEMKSWT